MSKQVKPTSKSHRSKLKYWGGVLHRLWMCGRKPQPVSRVFGLDRGRPIDRYYIDAFLQSNAPEIRGKVLEIGDDYYSRNFGGDRVTQCDVLHIGPGAPANAIIGDLVSGQGVQQGVYDCIILTQVLPFIYDVKAAIHTCKQALNPSGVVLATLPGLSQISRFDMKRWGDFWRFTSLSADRLFTEQFGSERVKVQTYGNVLSAEAFLEGRADHELSSSQLDHHDDDYQVLIGVRAVRPPQELANAA